MPRKVGSKNKPKGFSFSIDTNFEKHLMGTPLTRNSNRGWIYWGAKNDYCDKLTELYNNSVTHASCINFAVDAIVGQGIDYDSMEINDTETMPNYTQSWDEFIRCLALDFVMYGSYSFQVIKNRDGKTYSYYHQPIPTVRCSPRDEEGNITSYWICKDWTETGKNPPIEIERLGFTEDEKIAMGKPYLFVYETYTPMQEYYPTPKYIGGIKAVQTEIELLRYDLRSVVNNFSANGILTLPRVESEEERNDLVRQIKKSFVGADNSNSLIINFANGDIDDTNKPQFTKIDSAVSNVNLFNDTNERIIDKIVSAHRIPSKSLIGFPSDSASLGGDGNVLNVSYNLYNMTVAQNNRNAIINTINKMFALNGIETRIVLKPLKFNISEASASNESTTSNKPNEDDLTNNNIVEKITNINE